MVRAIKSWIILLFKKTLANRAFIAMLFIIPALCISLGAFISSTEKKAVATIYLYARSSDELSENVINSLIGEYNGYSFEYAESEEMILHEVRNHNALCGYILEKNQLNRARQGKTDGNIILVERIGNINTDIVNEIVFSSYYKEYSKYYTMYCMNGDIDSNYDANYYQLVDSSILNYTIEEIEPDRNSSNNSSHQARNLVGIVLFLFAMLNMSSFIQDNEQGILYPIKPKNRLLFRFFYFGTPLTMLIPFIYLGVILQKNQCGYLKEFVDIITYNLLLIILCVIFSFIIKKRHIIIGMIPVLTILFIIICPVFIDLATYLPIIRILRYICPPYFYML